MSSTSQYHRMRRAVLLLACCCAMLVSSSPATEPDADSVPNCTLSALQHNIHHHHHPLAEVVFSGTLVDNRTCAVRHSASILLGPSCTAERSLLCNVPWSPTPLMIASQRQQEVVQACPNSAYARHIRGEHVDVASEAIALQLRRRPHVVGLHHDELCPGVANLNAVGPSSAFSPMTLFHSVVGTAWDLEDLFTVATGVISRIIGAHRPFVTSLLQSFVTERITLRATNMSVSADAYLAQGARLMLHHAQKHIRVQMFPPTVRSLGDFPASAGKDAAERFVCDTHAALMLDATHTTMMDELQQHHHRPQKTSIMSSLWRTGDSAASPSSALVQPHCQFRLAGEDSRDFFNGALRRLWAGDAFYSVVGITVDASLGFYANDGSPLPTSFDATCELERRLLADPVCLAVQSSAETQVTVASALHVDTLWVTLLLSFLVVTALRPFFLRFACLQLLLCFILGVVVALCVAVYYVAHDLQRTRMGKVGILALLASGGVMFAIEGAMSAFVAVALREAQTNHSFHAIVVIASFLSAIFSHVVLASFLPRITAALFTLSQVSLLLLMVGVNIDATAVCAALVAVWSIRVVPFTLRVLFQLVRWVAVRPVTAVRGLPSTDNWGDRSSGPSDHVPVLPEDHEAPYRRPLASSSYGAGRSAEDRLAAYDAQGSEHTRRALEQLAATVRAHPEKYVGRVRDPNGLARFAGV